MKHGFLDQYADLDSLIHRLDPRVKLLTTLAFVLAVVATPPTRWLAFACYFGLITLLILLSRVPPAYIFKRSLVIVPYVVLVAIFIPFFKAGEVAGSFGVGPWHLSVSRSGLLVLWNVVIKGWLSVLAVILLSSTTSFPRLLRGLGQLRVPKLFVTILSFMYRYAFVLVDEVARMWRARESRSFGGGRAWRLRTLGAMIGTLFIRSYERGERVYQAMLARGFEGEVRTLEALRLRRLDVAFSLLLVAALVSVNVVTFIAF